MASSGPCRGSGWILRAGSGEESREDGAALLGGIMESAGIKSMETEAKERVIDAASGLTTIEAENAFALSVVESKAIHPVIVAKEKANGSPHSGAGAAANRYLAPQAMCMKSQAFCAKPVRSKSSSRAVRNGLQGGRKVAREQHPVLKTYAGVQWTAPIRRGRRFISCALAGRMSGG